MEPGIALVIVAAATLVAILVFAAVARERPRVPGWAAARAALSWRTLDRFFPLVPLLYAVVLSAMSVASYLAFNTDGYDLGIFDQVVWNSLHGRLFANTILPDAPLVIGQHFSPILLTLVPLYAVWSSPIVLLILQTVGIAASAFPLYWLARERLGRPAAYAVVVAYLLSPALQYVNLSEFHEIGLAVPLVAFATYLMLHRRDGAFLACLAVTLLVKEEMAFVVVMFGLCVLVVRRDWRLGGALLILGVVWGVFLLQYLLPFLRSGVWGGAYYYFGNGIAAGTGRYDYLGRNLAEVVTNLVTRPDLVLGHVLTPAKIDFLLALLVPAALLPLAGPELAALALPTIATCLLSDYPLQYSIQSHYPASIVPFLYFGVVVGLQRIAQWGRAGEVRRKALQSAGVTALLVASGAGYFALSAGPLARGFDAGRYALTAHSRLGHDILQKIPAGVIVMAQSEMIPHLSNRPAVYGFPSLDYCVPEYLVGDTTRYKYQLFQTEWQTWLGTGRFEMLAEQDGYLLARAKSPDRPLAIDFGGQLKLTRFTVGMTAQPTGGQPLCPLVEWQMAGVSAGRFVARMALRDRLGHELAVDQVVLGGSDGMAERNGQARFALRLAPTVPAGTYDLAVSVIDKECDCALEASTADPVAKGMPAIIATLDVAKDKRSILASQLLIEHPYYVDMQEMRFLGYAAIAERVGSGTTMPVGLYWRARGKPRGDYEVVLQLRDDQGQVIVEHAGRPAGGTYPTTDWSEGEVLIDWHDLPIPADVAAGTYALRLALKDMATGAVLGEAPVSSVWVVAPGE